jgi:hypothetical protein
MMNTRYWLVLFMVGLGGLADAQDKNPASYPTMAPAERYRIADPQQEIALARTAAPPSISADAEVLVLGERGYQVAVKGKNGFVCFIERSWTAGFDDPVFWDPQIRAPNCFNPPAVRSVLPQFLKRTEWALAGVTREQMVEKTRAAFASHQFRAPDAGSFSFMLSNQSDLGDPAGGGPWRPHVMFFVPHGQAAAWAAGLDASPVFGKESRAIEPTVLFIPVPQWSDGSPAPGTPAAGHQH